MHLMCMMEELMPSIGTPVPSPSVLGVVISQSDSALQHVGKLYSDNPHTYSPDVDFDTPLDFCDESLLVSKIHLISISDDGKIWSWLLRAEGPEDALKDARNSTVEESSDVPVLETNSGTVVLSADEPEEGTFYQQDNANIIERHSRRSTVKLEDMSFKARKLFCQISMVKLFLSIGWMLHHSFMIVTCDYRLHH